MATIAIKESHAKTGRAGKSRKPVVVTDHGMQPPHRISNRRRILLSEYTALLAKTNRDNVLEDLAVVRGER